MARILQKHALDLSRIVLLVLLPGCLIPPPLEKEGNDGGPNHPPQILWDTIQPALPDLTKPQSVSGKPKVTQRFVIGVFDPDPQTIYLNIFLDGIKDLYTKPIRSEQALGSGKRAFVVDIDGPCDELVNYSIDSYDLEFYVSDSGFLAEGEQRLPRPGGQATSIRWRLHCVFPPPALDGGV